MEPSVGNILITYFWSYSSNRKSLLGIYSILSGDPSYGSHMCVFMVELKHSFKGWIYIEWSNILKQNWLNSGLALWGLCLSMLRQGS